MFSSMGVFALKLSIRKYGPSRIYRDLYRINKKNVLEKDVRQNINETLKFFLRDETVEILTVIENKNIQYLVKKAKCDIEKNEILSKILSKLKIDF